MELDPAPKPQPEATPAAVLARRMPWHTPREEQARREWDGTEGPNPFQVVRYLNLSTCTALADVGCGPGACTLEAAREINPYGVLYAMDTDDRNLQALAETARAANYTNIHPLPLPADGTLPLAADTCDAAIISRFRHPFNPDPAFLTELRRVLRPAGLALWVERDIPGTRDDDPSRTRWNQRQDMVNAFTRAGFILFGTCDVGPGYYGLKFFCHRDANEPFPSMADGAVPSTKGAGADRYQPPPRPRL